MFFFLSPLPPSSTTPALADNLPQQIKCHVPVVIYDKCCLIWQLPLQPCTSRLAYSLPRFLLFNLLKLIHEYAYLLIFMEGQSQHKACADLALTFHEYTYHAIYTHCYDIMRGSSSYISKEEADCAFCYARNMGGNLMAIPFMCTKR